MTKPRFDLVVTGGTAVTPTTSELVDVAVTGEVIAAIGSPGAFANQAESTLDATGCLVLPGGVDPHVHYNLGLPGLDGAIIPDETQEYSWAAAFGGTTTIIDFAQCDSTSTLKEAIGRKQDEAAGRMAVDYGLHALLIGNPSFEVIDEIGSVIREGIPTVKTASACPPWTSDDGHRLGVMTELAKYAGLHIIHAEDQAIADWLTAKYMRSGKTHGAYTSETRGPLVEEAAIRRAILLAERTSCPLYVFHVGAETGAQAIREARARGLRVFGETLLIHLSFDSQKLWDDENRGLLWNNWPTLKSKDDQTALWAAVEQNVLQVVSSDHYAVRVEDRYRGMGTTIEGGGQLGQASVELRLPVLFHLGVGQGRLSPNRFVELVSTNPAKLMGLYPRKGALWPGSDADIVILDSKENWTVTTDQLHMSADYNCWEGWELCGRVKTTILRGSVLLQEGAWVGDKAGGRYLRRTLDPSFLAH
jgi:dihydropyrimidinase